MPSASSRARPPGFLSSGPPGMMTIGRSATGRSRPRRIASASGEASRSSHVDTSRLRASTSSSRRVSGSNREPISVRPAPRRIRIECRSRNVRRIRSLRPGSLGHDDPQLRDGNRQDPPGRGGHRGQVGTLPGEHADLAEELGPAVPGDERRAGLAVPLDDLGGAVQHHDQVISLVPVGEQHLAGGHVTLGAVPAQHLKLAASRTGERPGAETRKSPPPSPARPGAAMRLSAPRPSVPSPTAGLLPHRTEDAPTVPRSPGSPRHPQRRPTRITRLSSRHTPGNVGWRADTGRARACPVDHGMGPRSQIRIAATSTVPR